MTVSAFSAAKSLCELSDWSLSNLELQRLLYIAHMVHLGRYGADRPLIDRPFEAWELGPVVPAIYHRATAFGSAPVRNVFHGIQPAGHGAEGAILSETVKLTRGFPPSRLVAITHWDRGAWAKNYKPGCHGITIPDDDIWMEYHDRVDPQTKRYDEKAR